MRTITQCKVTMRASSPTEKERPMSQPGRAKLMVFFFFFNHFTARNEDNALIYGVILWFFI